MAIDDGGKGIGQLGLGIDVVQSAGFDQRGDHGPVLGARVVARGEGVLAV